MKKRIKAPSKFTNYKWKIIELLFRHNKISTEDQLYIKSCESRQEVYDYISSNLDKSCFQTLKNNKVIPFYKQSGYTKIIYTPMGSKR